jgi:hypothetical protein
MMVLLIALGILCQDAPQSEEDFRGQIRDLGSDQVKIRERALVALKNLPYARTDEVRKLAGLEADVEKRERLLEVVRCLIAKHSAVLFQEGKLKESLLKKAEAEGAQDPQTEMERRIRLARTFLVECFERYDDPGKKIIYAPNVLNELREKHGRYALPELLQSLRGPHSHDAFEFIRLGLRSDVVPFLCGFLKQKDCPMTYEVCALLGGMGGGDLTLSTLKLVMDDPSRDAPTRHDAKGALIQLKYLEADK